MTESSSRADIMVVVAHPDDELLCAGVIAHHARAGRSVVLVIATGGEGGPPCFDPTMPGADIARLRRQEMLRSADALGVKQVEFLGIIDRGYVAEYVTSDLADDLDAVTHMIVALLEKHRPKVVLTHGPDGEYGSGHHVQLSQCTHQAVQRTRAAADVLLYYFNAYYADAPLPRSNVSVKANYVFPVTGRNFAARRRAMLCHVSQLPVFIGYFGADMARECFHRVGPANEHAAWFEVVPD